MGGSNSKHNHKVLKTLHRGDIIKVVKPDGNKYYIYGGDLGKLYPLDEHSRKYFSDKENDMGEDSAVSFKTACWDLRCYKSSEAEWINETGGGSLSAREYNKKVMKTLLPGDIVKINLHNLLYIGNGIVIHLLSQNRFSGGSSRYNRLPRRHQKILDDCPGADGLVVTDSFLEVGKSTKAYKANRSDLHGLPYKMVIKRARSQLGPAEFNLCGTNCRNFVEEMKYGFQVCKKIRSFAVGKDPGILCLNHENPEMAEDIPSSDDDLSNVAGDFEVIEWIDDNEDSDVRFLDETHDVVEGLDAVQLVVDHGDE